MADEIPSVTIENLEEAKRWVLDRLEKRVQDRGCKAFASEHEVYGKLAEELLEFQTSIWKRCPEDEKILELEDIAVKAIWGIASYHAGMKQKRKK